MAASTRMKLLLDTLLALFGLASFHVFTKGPPTTNLFPFLTLTVSALGNHGRQEVRQSSSQGGRSVCQQARSTKRVQADSMYRVSQNRQQSGFDDMASSQYDQSEELLYVRELSHTITLHDLSSCDTQRLEDYVFGFTWRILSRRLGFLQSISRLCLPKDC